MLEEIPVNEPDIYAIRARGRLTHEDYARWIPRIEALLQERRPISLLVELVDFQGWEREAVWDDLRFGLEHDADLRRIAIVGEHGWQKLLVKLIRPFFTAELRYFDREEIDRAWAWLREDEARAAQARPHTYRHVVASLNFTPGARMVAAQAAAVARCHAAKLTLLAAVDDLPFYDQLEGPSLPDPVALTRELRNAAERRLQALAAQVDGVQVAVAVETGPPQLAVVDHARQHAADLLVLGGHTRHGLGRLLGSVTHGVLNDAPCDVLVVHLAS